MNSRDIAQRGVLAEYLRNSHSGDTADEEEADDDIASDDDDTSCIWTRGRAAAAAAEDEEEEEEEEEEDANRERRSPLPAGVYHRIFHGHNIPSAPVDHPPSAGPTTCAIASGCCC